MARWGRGSPSGICSAQLLYFQLLRSVFGGSEFRMGRGLPILSREPVDAFKDSSQHFLLSWAFSPVWNHGYLFSTLGHPDSV